MCVKFGILFFFWPLFSSLFASSLNFDSPEDLYAHLELLVLNHEKRASLFEIGRTYENRSIKVVKIQGRANSRVIVVEFGIHAREWASPASAVHIIQELLTNHRYRWMTNRITWYILPLVNPDGFSYSKSKDRMWRKNRQFYEHCTGTDINRNFPVGWSKSASHDECDELFPGPHPLSEKESRAIGEFVEKLEGSVSMYLSVHSCLQSILFPYAHSKNPPENASMLFMVANRIKSTIESTSYLKYSVRQASTVYLARGVTIDWLYDYHRIPISLILELPFSGRQGLECFNVADDEYYIIASDALAAMKGCALALLGSWSTALIPSPLPIIVLVSSMVVTLSAIKLKLDYFL